MSDPERINELSLDEKTIEIISDLCDMILIYEDGLCFDNTQEYIKKIIDDKITLKGVKYDVRLVIQEKVAKYIDSCPAATQLFAFASDNNYRKYRKKFKDEYFKYYYSSGGSTDGGEADSIYPRQFEYLFEYIQEAIDFHSLHERLSIKMYDDIVITATSEAKKASDSAAAEAKSAAILAKNAANKAAEQAIIGVLEEEKIEQQLSNKVDKQMNKVTSTVSKTSVTILGIFSGVVLTIVAGLFYSSSVLESISSTSLYRLICIASLVGIVCINLLVVMFKYIERIRNGKEKTNNDFWDTLKSNAWPIFLNVILIIIMIVSGVLQLKFPENQSNTANTESSISVNATVDVSNNESSSTEETTETMPSNTNEAK